MANLKSTINTLIEQLKVKIIYAPIDSGGKAFVPQKLIVINPNLSLKLQDQILLHELEHIKRKHSKTSYSSPNYLSRIEFEAERGRINADLAYYIEETPLEYWNVYNFSTHFNCKSEFETYIDFCMKNSQNIQNDREDD